METKSPKLYRMALGEELQISTDSTALRVPGGWIFTVFCTSQGSEISCSTTFVPFNNEFIKGKNNG